MQPYGLQTLPTGYAHSPENEAKNLQAVGKNEIKCKNRAGGKALATSVGHQANGTALCSLCGNAKLSVHVCLCRPVGHPVSQLAVSPLPVLLILLATNSVAFRSCFILHSHSSSLFTCRIFAAHQINKHTHTRTHIHTHAHTPIQCLPKGNTN